MVPGRSDRWGSGGVEDVHLTNKTRQYIATPNHLSEIRRCKLGKNLQQKIFFKFFDQIL